MRVWFAGGGTGGHLYPALAIARALVRERPDVQPFFIGAHRGIEREVLPGTEFPHLLLDLHPLYRSAVWRNWMTVTGGVRAWRAIGHVGDEEPPAALVATGGYAAGVALLYSAVRRVPIVLQEQNSVPGLTTRFFSRYARQIHLGFPEAERVLRPAGHTVVRGSGNPIQPPRTVSAGERTAALTHLGFDAGGARVVLVFGGSQGARAVNGVVADVVKGGVPSGVRLVWITGPNSHPQYVPLDSDRVRVLPYVTDMPLIYSVVDLAVARAGAMSTAELCAWGIPAILIPLPTAAADHQTTNAIALEQAGAASVIRQRELTPDSLRSRLQELLGDPDRLERMRAAALKRARPNAASEIAASIATLLPPQ